jgi:hypothetical protein
MFRYRLPSPDGDDLGDAVYAVVIQPARPPTPFTFATPA